MRGDGREELQTDPMGHHYRQSAEGPAATASASGARRDGGLARQVWPEGPPQRRGGLWDANRQPSRNGLTSAPSAANPFVLLASVRFPLSFTSVVFVGLFHICCVCGTNKQPSRDGLTSASSTANRFASFFLHILYLRPVHWRSLM